MTRPETGDVVLNVPRDFTTKPGHRFRKQGPNSGEQFLEEWLLPKFEEARGVGVKLRVEMDGVYGYPTSFLEEAFGGLAGIHGQQNVEQNLVLIREDDKFTIPQIIEYIRNAKPRKRPPDR